MKKPSIVVSSIAEDMLVDVCLHKMIEDYLRNSPGESVYRI